MIYFYFRRNLCELKNSFNVNKFLEETEEFNVNKI